MLKQSLLEKISKKAILLNEGDFTNEQIQSGWIGQPPATDDEIAKTEERLRVKLPDDYIQFLKITNGFPQYGSTCVTFASVDKIDYLEHIDEDLVEIWSELVIEGETVSGLKASILVGGIDEEQYFLLIPPTGNNDQWRYWFFASWMAGEYAFESLPAYFKNEFSSLQEATKGLRKPKAKFVTDFSLRDHVFNANWPAVFDTARSLLVNNIAYYYFDNPTTLLSLLLISASKLNRFDELANLLIDLKTSSHAEISQLLNRYEEAARSRQVFVHNFEPFPFKNTEPSITLENIEKQIEKYRPDLLRPKNADGKIDYQLYFLFEYGNAENYIKHYEQHATNPSFSDAHIKAAIAFATINDIENARRMTERYLAAEYTHRTLVPFVSELLFNKIMDEDFSRQLFSIIKAKPIPL